MNAFDQAKFNLIVRYNDSETKRRYSMSRVVYRHTAVSTGISMGTALAMILSYSVNQSILWAIIHGVLSWVYVLYFALFK